MSDLISNEHLKKEIDEVKSLIEKNTAKFEYNGEFLIYICSLYLYLKEILHEFKKVDPKLSEPIDEVLNRESEDV
jgi:hypothetical protein